MVSSVMSSPSAVAKDGEEKRPRRSKDERKKRAANRRPLSSVNTLVFNPFFVLLFGLLIISCMISFFLVFSHPEGAWGASSTEQRDPPKQNIRVVNQNAAAEAARRAQDLATQAGDDGGQDDASGSHDEGTQEVEEAEVEVNEYAEQYSAYQPEITPDYQSINPFDTTLETPHLLPKMPVLPPFVEIENSEQLIDDLLHNNKPTIAGIVAFLNGYLAKLHAQHKFLSEKESASKTKENLDEMGLVNAYFNLTSTIIDPLENAYRGRNIFPVRDDESVFISLAAFREHLLGKSMMSAFDNAKDPSKVFVGAIVQNCFGLDGTVCKTGLQVVGKFANGRDRTSVSPAPPDANGIEEFCNHKDYKKYCDSGQVRVVYVHDTDALGPQTARFYASKLWGGETYYMQMDAHLEFAPDWEQYYIDEAKLSKNYPKSVLSSYPPGFKEYDGAFKGGSRGERLCECHFSPSPVESQILRIGQGGLTPKDATAPTQIPFIAAGFFFAHSSFLEAVPFDPYAPWCFMGEEIALSMRAWTSGWNIYAPRQNVIAHQYRPGRLGLPKFWESVGRDSGRGSLNTRLQHHVLRRVKHMLTYPGDSMEKLREEGDEIALFNFKHYSLGRERELEDYLQWTHINPSKLETKRIDWCINSEVL